MKKFKILITWRFLLEDIKKYLPLLKKQNISYETFKTAQYVKEGELLKIIFVVSAYVHILFSNGLL